MRQRLKVQQIHCGTLVLFLLIYCGGAFAADPWVRSQDDVVSNPNCSVLSDTHYINADNLLGDVLDRRNTLELKQKYEDINRDYDMRHTYGLSSAFGVDDQNHMNQMGDLGHDAMQRAESYQGEKAKTSVTTNPNMQPLMAPAAVVGGAAALYRGSGVNVINQGDYKLRAKASLRNQTTGLELSSPVVHGSVDMTMTAPSNVDPNSPPPLDPSARTERYRLSLSRNLPFDISSGFNYGTTTSTMSASLSRKLTKSLTAVVGASKTMDPTVESITPSEQSLRLMYGLNF